MRWNPTENGEKTHKYFYATNYDLWVFLGEMFFYDYQIFGQT
jgi:hypothetical protein